MFDSTTLLYALFGNPVAHSLGPFMHNRAFREKNINAVYLAFAVSRIDKAVEAIRSLDIAGASITIPHKEAVIPFLDEIDSFSLGMGAVNTIVNRDGKLFGYNTDCKGAVDSLEMVCDLKEKRVVIIGAGGVARAVAFGIRQKQASVFIVNRSRERGINLAMEMGATFISREEISGVDPDIIVNATSIGMASGEMKPGTGDIPIDREILKPSMIVMDIVYTPVKTALIKAAMEKGCTIIDGLSMFVNQGAAQFELFTGKKAPIKIMQSALTEAIKKNENNR